MTRQLRGPHDRSRWPRGADRTGVVADAHGAGDRHRLLEAARRILLAPQVVAGAGAEHLGRGRRAEVECDRHEPARARTGHDAHDALVAERGRGVAGLIIGAPAEAQTEPVVRHAVGQVEVVVAESRLLGAVPDAVVEHVRPDERSLLVGEQSEAEEASRTSVEVDPREVPRLVPRPHRRVERMHVLVVHCAPSTTDSHSGRSPWWSSENESGGPHITLARVAVTTMTVAANAIQ